MDKAGQTGREVAAKLDWDGKEISEAFLEALTEANFHELRKQLEPIILKTFEL